MSGRPASAASKPGSASTDARGDTRSAATTGGAAVSPSHRDLQQRLANLNEELASAKQREEDAEQERDFYFSKLREIELLCQQEGVKERWDIMQGVENILYAATEEEGSKAREVSLQSLLHANGDA